VDQIVLETAPGHPEVVRLVAPNPGPMTLAGTNTYLYGSGPCTVIDPGPDAPSHLDAVCAAAEERGGLGLVLLTHTHGDHTGNDGFFGTSVEIVAQDNTKANMEKMDAFKGDNAKFLPKKTYQDKLTLGSGKDRIDLYYFGAGHTNGDTFVVFPALRVLHTGDMFAWKDGPYCDLTNGGSCVALPRTLR